MESCCKLYLLLFANFYTKRYYNSVIIVLAHWTHGSGHSMLDPWQYTNIFFWIFTCQNAKYCTRKWCKFPSNLVSRSYLLEGQVCHRLSLCTLRDDCCVGVQFFTMGIQLWWPLTVGMQNMCRPKTRKSLLNHSIPNMHWQHSFSFVIFAFKSLEGALLCIASQPNLQNFFSKVATFGQSTRCHMGRTNLRVTYEVDVTKKSEKTTDQKGGFEVGDF